MKPGFKISLPKNVIGAKTNVTTYGTLTVSNSWRRKTNEARDLSLDQFSGKTVGDQTAYGYGAVSYDLDTLISTPTVTQIGLPGRIMMTLLPAFDLVNGQCADAVALTRSSDVDSPSASCVHWPATPADTPCD